MPHQTPPDASQQPPHNGGYRGRIAPTPTGLLHLGHARTFYTAWQRARAARGTLIYRQEDLDPLRCTPAFAQAAIDDLHRYGLDWDEGPGCMSQGHDEPSADRSCDWQTAASAQKHAATADAKSATAHGPHEPYSQSQRTALYCDALVRLIRSGHAYPSAHSRSDLSRALESGLARPCPPQFGEQDSEAIFPSQWRPSDAAWFTNAALRERIASSIKSRAQTELSPSKGTNTPRPLVAPVNISRGESFSPNDLFDANSVVWRFRVPDGEVLQFTDGGFGEQSFTAGEDFGDFVLWRRDGVPAYELAVVTDDIAMGITEVVRGADLLRSTARQLLLYRALGAPPPAFYHCPLLLDPQTGERLAKRSESLSLRLLLERGTIEPVQKTRG